MTIFCQGLFDNQECTLICESGFDCCNTDNSENQLNENSGTETYECNDGSLIDIPSGTIF